MYFDNMKVHAKSIHLTSFCIIFAYLMISIEYHLQLSARRQKKPLGNDPKGLDGRHRQDSFGQRLPGEQQGQRVIHSTSARPSYAGVGEQGSFLGKFEGAKKPLSPAKVQGAYLTMATSQDQ
jgi:hypothetical protein